MNEAQKMPARIETTIGMKGDFSLSAMSNIFCELVIWLNYFIKLHVELYRLKRWIYPSATQKKIKACC